jgi:hypothetical protein
MTIKTHQLIICIILAIIISLLACELVCRFIIGYPVYSVDSKIHYRQGGEYWTTFWQPHAKQWNVEAGNEVITFNNLGLPGIDVDLSKKHYIAVLGSSYVEAMQMFPEKNSCSYLANFVSRNYKDYSVMNLGYYRHDPFDSWWRMEYFKKKFPIDFAILVLTSDNTTWFKSHQHPLSFIPANDFGRRNNSKIVNFTIALRNFSSFINLLAISQKGEIKLSPDTNPIQLSQDNQESSNNKMVFSSDMSQTLLTYKKTCNNFILVSIIDDAEYNHMLETFTSQNDIFLQVNPLLKKQYKLKNGGHLNEEGNKLLGNVLIRAFEKYQEKKS